jgi:drug/metabolite transporter (DMT)-like permease
MTTLVCATSLDQSHRKQRSASVCNFNWHSARMSAVVGEYSPAKKINTFRYVSFLRTTVPDTHTAFLVGNIEQVVHILDRPTSNQTHSKISAMANGSNSNSLQVPILAVVFASSGAALNILQQQLYYAGAGDGSLLILIVPTFVGMIVGGFASANTRQELFGGGEGKKASKEFSRRMKQVLAVSMTDVTSLTLRSMSQNMCGSGMFTVIYASLPAFNGVLSYFFLNRILNKWQWLSMAVVVLGLAFSAEAEQDDLHSQKAIHKVAIGICLGLAGTLFSSASYVCAERVLKGPGAPRHPTTLTAINGVNDMLLTSPWLLMYSIPHRQDLLYEPVASTGQSPVYLVFLWLCLVAANAAHLNACYMLLRITESVTLTMLQGTIDNNVAVHPCFVVFEYCLGAFPIHYLLPILISSFLPFFFVTTLSQTFQFSLRFVFLFVCETVDNRRPRRHGLCDFRCSLLLTTKSRTMFECSKINV